MFPASFWFGHIYSIKIGNVPDFVSINGNVVFSLLHRVASYFKRMVFAEVVTRIPYHGAVLSDDTPVTDVTSAFVWSVLGSFADPAVVTTVAFTVRI